MSDEQTIYIGPEDDLTSVRERLQNVESRHVILIIPAQTQLRSHVAWKLLHSRAREMGKDVLIVSSDPQVRSVAQAVKFRVAQSLEAPPSRPRLGSRPVRSTPPRGRGGSRKSLDGRGPGSRRSRQLERPSERWQDTPPSPAPLSSSYTKPSIEPLAEHPAPIQEIKSKPAQLDETYTDVPAEESPAKEYGPSYTFDVDSVPPIRSLPPQGLDDDEADQLFEDYNQAQSIRRSAMQGKANEPASRSEESSSLPHNELVRNYAVTPLSSNDAAFTDPFTYLDDALPPPPRSEQRGSVTMDQLDSGLHPIPETPVSQGSGLGSGAVIDGEIEDLGDLGSIDAFPGKLQRPAMDDENVEDVSTPSVSPPHKSKRSVPLSSRARPAPERDEREETPEPRKRPVIEEQPTIIIPQRPTVEASPLRSSGREMTPVHSRAVRPAAGVQDHPNQVHPSSRHSQISQRPPSRRTGPTTTRSRASRRSSARRGQRNRGNLLMVMSIVLVLLVVALVAYFVPSANVTITFAGRSYSHAITLVAQSSGQGSVGPRSAQAGNSSVPAQSFSRDFNQDGSGTATGSKRVDNRTATGSVTFTNTGSANITIPSGTIVETQNGIQFATTAEAVVTTPGSGLNAVDVPVQAQKPGASSNVGVGTITVLPDESKSQIARASHLSSADQLKLKLTNSAATTGGGAGNVTVVSRDDLSKVTQKLQDALNDDIQSWLAQLKKSPQDVVGKPQLQSTLIDAPKEGDVVETNTFSAQLHISASVLVVRASDLQNASVAPLNTLLKQEKDFAGYTISSDAAPSIQFKNLKTSGEGNELTLNFTAQASATPSISIEEVQRQVSGKSPDAARAEILRTYQHVKDVKIETFPSFISWIAFWPPHINIHLVPVS